MRSNIGFARAWITATAPFLDLGSSASHARFIPGGASSFHLLRFFVPIFILCGSDLLAPRSASATFIGLGSASDYVLFDVSNSQWSMNSSTVVGKMAAGPGSTFNFSGGGGPYTGNFYYHLKAPADPSPNGNSAVPPVGNLDGYTGSVIGTSLTQAVTDVRNASTQLAALTVNQPLVTSITGNAPLTITGAGAGSMNVYNLTDVDRSGGTVTITGTSTEIFIFRVSGKFNVGNSQIRVGGGVTPEHVLWDVTGAGMDVKSPNGGWDGTLLALNRKVSFDNTPGTPSSGYNPIRGQIIGADDATASSGNTFMIVSGLDITYHPFTMVAPTMSITTAEPPKTVIVGCDNDFSALVTNTGGASAGPLNYSLSATFTAGGGTIGAITPGSGTLNQGGSQSNTFNVAGNIGLNTIKLTVSSVEASNSPQFVSFTQTVLNHSDAQLKDAAIPGYGVKTLSLDKNNLEIDFGPILQGSGLFTSYFDILAAVTTAGFTAELDLNSIETILGSPAFQLFGASSFTNKVAGGTEAYSATFDTSAIGAYSAVYKFKLNDQQDLDCCDDLDSQILTLTLTGNVFANVPEPGTGVLFGLGALAVVCVSRRRAKQ